jgi:hypothetical protein
VLRRHTAGVWVALIARRCSHRCRRAGLECIGDHVYGEVAVNDSVSILTTRGQVDASVRTTHEIRDDDTSNDVQRVRTKN